MGLILDKCCCSNDARLTKTRRPALLRRPTIAPIRNQGLKRDSWKSCGWTRLPIIPVESPSENSFPQHPRSVRPQFASFQHCLSRASPPQTQQSTTPKKDFLHVSSTRMWASLQIGKEIATEVRSVRLVAKKSYEKKRFALKSIPRDKLNADI